MQQLGVVHSISIVRENRNWDREPRGKKKESKGSDGLAVLEAKQLAHYKLPAGASRETMQAVVLHQFGDPRLLPIEEVPTPAPRDGQALVKVAGAAINPSDVKNVRGAMHGTTLPRIPGRDFAGTVAAGPREWIGKEVWGSGGDIGFTRDGSHAQFILVPTEALTPKPANLSMDQAGSAGLTFITAWSALVTAAVVRAKERVLIVGAAGGVGSAAVQIAKAKGARVIGAVRSEEERQRAIGVGADDAVDITQRSMEQAVKEMTLGRGADVLFDTSGAMFAECVEAASMRARVVVITAPADGKTTFNLRSLYRKELAVHGVDTRQLDAVACAGLLRQIGLALPEMKVAVGRGYPLAEAATAYEQAGKGKGRVYLRPNG